MRGVVDQSLGRPSVAGRRPFWNSGDRVGQSKHAASEPDPDVGAAFEHRLKDGDGFAFSLLADQRLTVSAGIAHRNSALVEDGNGVLVVRDGRLEAQRDRCSKRTPRVLHMPVLLLSSAREVDADNGGGQFVHCGDVRFCPSYRTV